MRKWVGVVWAGLGGAALAAGCGSSGGTPGNFAPPDDASLGGDGSSGSGSSSGARGDDASAQDATFGADSASGSGSGSSSGAIIDASLDVPFPDVFAFPDTGGASGGSTGDGGDVEGGACAPNGVTCQGNTAYTCAGGVLTTTACPQACANGYGCVACVPGTGSCAGSVGTACNESGTGTVTNDCDSQLGETCNPTTGQCQGDCANVGQSYIGCEYYAVTMANQELDQKTFGFSVSISNTSANAATIAITGPAAYAQTAMLAAGAIQNFVLPWVPAVSCPNGTCNPTNPHAVNPPPGTVQVSGGAYHIKSTEPITVYQFNAYQYQVNSSCQSDTLCCAAGVVCGCNPCHSYTNDASLLIPVNAMTGNYYVVAGADWYTPGDTGSGGTCSTTTNAYQEPGMVAIVGTQNGTSVTVQTTGPMQAGASLGTSGGKVTLNAGDVLEISSALNATAACSYASDLSGSRVTASAPVEVIGGQDCSFTPAGTYACDHLEQINFPIETLRDDYLVTLPYNKNGTPRQYVKIVGTAAGTTLFASPAQIGLPATIGAGGVAWFEVTQDFRLTASQPVIVGQFMEGQYAFGSNCTKPNLQGPADCGDPSMSLAVATAQFRTSYQFIAPPSYYENWVNVIAPTGATVQVDGAAVSGASFTAVGNSGYGVAHVSLCGNTTSGCTGNHTATSSVPFGIEVYGYGYFTSYMYPGGLNLSRQ